MGGKERKSAELPALSLRDEDARHTNSVPIAYAGLLIRSPQSTVPANDHYTRSSQLRTVQMRFILSKCLLRRLRYRSLIILNVLILALMFSMTIRSRDNSRLNDFCSTVKGWFLLDLCGMRLFLCKFNNP